MENITFSAIAWALISGFLPVMFWLWFWLRQDCHPEPKSSIMIGFMAGSLATVLCFFLEKMLVANPWIPESNRYYYVYITPAVEELVKFVLAMIFVLRSKDNDERIDSMIYMITVALGFAALENALFLIDPLVKGDLTSSIITGNMRFVGATLIHTVSSAVIGLTMSISYCWSSFLKPTAILIGVILAVGLHSLFNFFIIKQGGSDKIYSFIIVWGLTIILMIAFERIRRAKQVCSVNY